MNSRLSTALEAICVVTAGTLVNMAIHPAVADADLVMVFLLGVMAMALRGPIPAVAATLLSITSFNFFFVQPLFTFSVDDGRYLITFLVMGVVGASIGLMASGLRNRERESYEQAFELESERMKTALLSSVSHDFRTPLGVILGASTMLVESEQLSAADRELAHSIVTSTERLSHHFENVLHRVRLKADKRAKMDWYVPEESIGAIVASLDCEVDVNIEYAAELAWYDETAFISIMTNLLANAQQHGQPPIRLDLEWTETELVATVTNAGSIPESDIEHLFTEFHHGSSSQGTGLGLSIARQLARGMNGDLHITSRMGHTTATLRVPQPKRPEEDDHE